MLGLHPIAAHLALVSLPNTRGFFISSDRYFDFGGGGHVRVTNSHFDGPGQGTAFDIHDGPTSLKVSNSTFDNLTLAFVVLVCLLFFV